MHGPIRACLNSISVSNTILLPNARLSRREISEIYAAYIVPSQCMFHQIFAAYFIILSLEQILVSGIYIAVVNMTWVVRSLRLALSKGPERLGISRLFT
jgi:hypothetical protein